ncbi:MAG TPA: LpqB family beta-propeller domain-containing protein, partial [Vicinamibacteria bacterium]|nr:LpqB family beta-propeller domain-containing protein [Vicinamibacteria bacterium]
LTTPAEWSGLLSVSKDGRRLAFGTRDWRADAWKVAFDPEGEVLAGPPVPVLRGQPLQELRWSPDGALLAFSRRSLPWESLGIVRADGTGYSQLSDASYQHRALSVSPDGQSIAFFSQRESTTQVWTMRIDGSGLRRVSAGKPAFAPSWSPDGRRIAAGSDGGVALFDPSLPSPSEPAERLPVGDIGSDFNTWSWSPDGRSLLGGPQATFPGGLYLYSIEARTVRKLDDSSEAAAWLPDSRRILFNKRGALVLMDVVSGRRKEILPQGSLPQEGSWTTFSVTRDGRWIAYLEARREGDIWLAEFPQ